MKIAKFRRCVDPTDLATIVGWLDTNYDHNVRCPSIHCIDAYGINDFTQQEMDDMETNATAKFMEVTFE